VDENDIILQSGDEGRLGFNGVGGLTVNGNIVDMKVLNADDDVINIVAEVQSYALGSFTLNMWVDGTGYARAVIRGLHGIRTTFRGYFNSLDEAYVYEGISVV